MSDIDDQAGFTASKLGTKDHWDQVYQKEIRNFNDHGDIGEIWFGEDSVEKMMDWITNYVPDKAVKTIDLGCGNGHLLLEMAALGFTSLLGVDYSQSSVDLAVKVAADKGHPEIAFKTFDLLVPPPAELAGAFALALDKGTLDAISLAEDRLLAREVYPRNVAAMLGEGGILLITSCNWTEAELVEMLKSREFYIYDLMFVARSSSSSTTRPGLVGEVHRHPDARLDEYPTQLNWFDKPPAGDISLDDFEQLALARLRLLKTIENCQVRSKSADETSRILKALSDEVLPMTSNLHVKHAGADLLLSQRRKDHVSHFILRLAFCRTEDNRAWFVRQETALFKYRLENEVKADRDSFLRRHGLDCPVLPTEERNAFASDLRALHQEKSEGNFFKVAFERVLPLVSSRSVLLSKGFAFLPESDLPVLVTSAFREHLQASVEATARSIPRMEEEDRLIPMLNNIARQMASRDYASLFGGQPGAEGAIKAEQVYELSRQGHFPPCMMNLTENLRADGHVKHFGRYQLGLFLKGIGVPLEEALEFWRKALSKIAPDRWEKEYAYNVRFNYGHEGSRKNYTPHSCMKIITSNAPSPGDHHGCPFRHSTPEHLRAILGRMGTPEASVGEVMRMAKEGHYQIACTRLFEVTRANAMKEARKAAAAAAASGKNEEGGPTVASMVVTGDGLVDTIEHPNQWFDLSYRGHVRRRAPRQDGPAEGGDSMDVDR